MSHEVKRIGSGSCTIKTRIILTCIKNYGNDKKNYTVTNCEDK
jgi:hypothetical protein